MSQSALKHSMFINSVLVQTLQCCTMDSNLLVRRHFVSLPHTVNITMGASKEGWGGNAQGSGLCSILLTGCGLIYDGLD